MEDKDLNLAIANYKGLDVEILGTEKIVSLMGERDGQRYGLHPVDYINDPALILELDNELLDTEEWDLCKLDGIYWWECNGEVCMITNSEHRGRATALAYHKQFIGDL